MGTLKGFAPPFGPSPASASPLASLGLAMPSRDGTPPAKPVGSPRGNLPREAICHGLGQRCRDPIGVEANRRPGITCADDIRNESLCETASISLAQD